MNEGGGAKTKKGSTQRMYCGEKMRFARRKEVNRGTEKPATIESSWTESFGSLSARCLLTYRRVRAYRVGKKREAAVSPKTWCMR